MIFLNQSFFFPICDAKVSISSAERIHSEGGKPGERAPSKKGKEKGKEVRISREMFGSQPRMASHNAMLKTLLRCGFLNVISSFLLSFLCPADDSNSGILESPLINLCNICSSVISFVVILSNIYSNSWRSAVVRYSTRVSFGHSCSLARLCLSISKLTQLLPSKSGMFSFISVRCRFGQFTDFRDFLLF